MNIHKYLLPATLAATVHVVLFKLAPEGAVPLAETVVEALILPPLPKTDELTLPPEEPMTDPEPVKALANSPTPPRLPEQWAAPKPDDLTVPLVDRRKRTDRDVRLIPENIGPGTIGMGGDIGRPGIFSLVDLDRVPGAKVQLPPDYPAAMRQAGVGGSVLVEFDVNAEGRVVRAAATRYTHREFAEPAVRAVRKWRFEPGRRHGQAVPFRLTVPIEFSLERH